MQDELEKLIKLAYKKWKADCSGRPKPHPDEETLSLFFEGLLPTKESESVKAHLITCESCAEGFAIQISLRGGEEKQVPQELVEQIKNLVTEKRAPLILEIFLRAKGQALEIINTTGDVLVGQEFIPAPVLRSREIKSFKDEVTILKDFKDIRIEVKIENKQGGHFSLSIAAKEKKTQTIIKNLRVTLFKDDLELESYLNESGKVTFEHLLLGKYALEITDINDKLASILLDIKV